MQRLSQRIQKVLAVEGIQLNKLIKLVDKTLERTAESNAMAVATVAASSDENKMIDADANILLIPRNRLRKPIKSTELYTTNGSKIYARIHSQTLYSTNYFIGC